MKRIAGKIDRLEAQLERGTATGAASSTHAAELIREVRALRAALPSLAVASVVSSDTGMAGPAISGASISHSSAPRAPSVGRGVTPRASALPALPAPVAAAARDDVESVRRELRRTTEAYSALSRDFRSEKLAWDARERELTAEVTRLKTQVRARSPFLDVRKTLLIRNTCYCPPRAAAGRLNLGLIALSSLDLPCRCLTRPACAARQARPSRLRRPAKRERRQRRGRQSCCGADWKRRAPPRTLQPLLLPRPARKLRLCSVTCGVLATSPRLAIELSLTRKSCVAQPQRRGQRLQRPLRSGMPRLLPAMRTRQRRRRRGVPIATRRPCRTP